MTVINVQLSTPFNNKLILSFFLIGIVTIKTQNVETQFTLQLVSDDVDLIVFSIEKNRVEVFKMVFVIDINFDVFLDVNV